MNSEVEKTPATRRPKTGGRKAGTPNKPKAARSGAAPAPPFLPVARARAREAYDLPSTASPFPRYRLAKVDTLLHYANNARTHTPAQIDKIVASIREFGFTNPVLTDGRKGIVAGHGRALAAQKLGMDTVPTIELSHLSAAQRRAYIIADNRLALDAGWDDELLTLELGELKDLGFDLALTGFDGIELDALFNTGNEGLTDPDDIPEERVEVVSRLGDVWVLGRHRLVCGSATSEADHALAIDGAKIDAVLTDPPYGVGINYGQFVDTEENVRELIEGFLPLVRRWPVVAFTSGNRVMWDYPRPTWVMAWVHPAGMGNGPWGFNQFHPILVYGGDPYLKQRKGSRPDSIVLATDRKQQDGHPTPKPIKLWEWLVERVTTKPNTHLLEPFSGSGTTIIAAEMTGRVCHAIEIEPRYVDVAVRRWQSFTGQAATLESTGVAFAETALERAAAISKEPLTEPPPESTRRKRRAA